MRFPLIAAIAVALALCCISPTLSLTIVSSDVSTDTEWYASKGPYVVKGQIRVWEGVQLLIEPGTVVKFMDSQSGIFVSGKLVAGETGAAYVYFTSYRDDKAGGDTNGDGIETSPTDGDWAGIMVAGEVASAQFTRCYFRFGGGIAGQAMLEARTAEGLGVVSCNLSRSATYGINCFGTALQMTGCRFSTIGKYGVSLQGQADCILSGNQIQDATTYGIDARYCDGISILDNMLTNCRNGIRIYSCDNSSIQRNTISGATTGIYINSCPGVIHSDTTLSAISTWGVQAVGSSGDFGIRSAKGSGGRGVYLSGCTIQANEQWDSGTVFPVYAIGGNLTVSAGNTLAISPGARVKLSGAACIINGRLEAEGTPTTPINFTSLMDDSVGGDSNGDGSASIPGAGDWGGIRTFGSGASSKLVNCILKYGGYDAAYGILSGYSGGALTATNCVLDRSKNVAVHVGDVTSASIFGSLITNSGSIGINIAGANSTTFTNCTLSGNPTGVSISSGTATVSNSIIAFGSTGIIRTGGTFYASNNCVHGNTSANYSGISSGMYDTNQDPLFVDRASGNYRLSGKSSPCYDKGYDGLVAAGQVDLDGSPRISGTHVDMGAYELDATMKWYVESTGDDANTGQSWAQAKRTVQAAIDSAAPGEEVWVAAGTYTGRILVRSGVAVYGGFAGTESTRAQRNWRANISTLDGNKGGSVVTFADNAVFGSLIDGFTIRNGYSAGSDGKGGGIRCGNLSEVIITNNIICDNYAQAEGGGIYCQTSRCLVTNNLLIRNFANLGGGVSLRTSYNNTEFLNNCLYSNTASQYGGGVYATTFSGPITGNTIVGNMAAKDGGGMYIGSDVSLISSNIVAFNSSGIRRDNPYTSTPTCRNNDVYGNGSYAYSGFPSDPTGQDGNLAADPLFANPSRGNLHIQSNSPCRDHGNDTDQAESAVDMDGQARVQGAQSDIGADESDGTTWNESPLVIYVDGIAGDNAHNGQSWGYAKRSIQDGIEAAYAQGGGKVWVKAGIYAECLTLHAGVYAYGGFAGNETSEAQRNLTANITTVDAGKAGSVVTMSEIMGYQMTGIDGFALRNGQSSNNGGGIYCTSSSTITNCAITACSASTGGGIYVTGAPLSISNCTLSSNSSTGGGGGIYLDSSNSTISNCTISGNTGSSGAGIGMNNIASKVIISGCAIMNNTNSVTGGGIDCTGNNLYGLDVTNCTFRGNSAGRGSAIRTDDVIIATITGNSFSDNMGNDGSTGCGAAVYTKGTATLSNNTFERNIGGGACCEGWMTTNTVVSGNIFRDNGGNDASYGGGLHCRNWDPNTVIQVTGNAFSGNSANYGGAIYCNQSRSAVISGNIITGNWAMTQGGGIGSYASQVTISNNVISGNTATTENQVGGISASQGGGIGFQQSTVTAVNNSIVRNSASGEGGGIYQYAGNMSLANNLVADNSSGICSEGGQIATPRNGCVWGNGLYNYKGIADPTGTNGNISQDPKLANSLYLEIHLQPDSPCRDTGFDSVVGSDWKDMDGQSRIQGAHVDIGADEIDGLSRSVTPRIVRVKPDGLDTNDGSSWALARRTIQAGIDALGSTGGEVWVQAGTYYERISMGRMVHLYGGFAGSETARTERNPRINLTVLDGEHTGTVVTATSRGYLLSTLDGFTIQNGKGTDGYAGGIFCPGSVLIANNRITANSAQLSAGGIQVFGASRIAGNQIVGNMVVSDSGGGIYCRYSTEIINNIIAANSAPHAAGIYCCVSTALIANNTIVANTASQGKGGIDLWSSGGARVINNIIAGNHYWGVYLNNGDPVPVFRNNCLYDNPCTSNLIPDASNLSVDPQFVNSAGGDYHISLSSPCIEKGDDSVIGADWRDTDGEERRFGQHVDIGADEVCAVTRPSFSPEGGIYYSPQTVTVSCALAGVTIHYTLNGNDPTESDPVIASGGTLLIDHTLTLKVKAWKNALIPSGVIGALYEIRDVPSMSVSPTAVTKVIQPGTKGQDTITISNAEGANRAALNFSAGMTGLTFPTYVWSDSKQTGGPVYNWIDISGQDSGASSVDTLTDDSVAGPFSIGFDFPFYGTSYQQFYISSNGFIGFGPSASYPANNNVALPNASAPNNMICWLWDDLYPHYEYETKVHYQTRPEGLVVQFSNYGVFSSNTPRITAEIILQRSGEILIQYKEVKWGFPVNGGTVGIENATGTSACQVVCNGSYIEDNLAVRFTNYGVRVNPMSGSVAAGQSNPLILSYDGTIMTPGLYNGSLRIESNDPKHPTQSIPITLKVQNTPDTPSGPSPADGATGVALNTKLQWNAAALAQSYDITLWKSSLKKPSSPTAADLSVPAYQPAADLEPGATYRWQVVAKNSYGSTAGPEWSFTTSTTQSFVSPTGFAKFGRWNLVSVPGDPMNPDPLVVFAGIDIGNASLQYWKNETDGGGYVNYGPSDNWYGPIQRGTPYWFMEPGTLGSSPDKTISFQGTAGVDDFEKVIPAHSGAPFWVMLGTPFAKAVLADNIRFKNVTKRGDVWLNWSQGFSLADPNLRIIDSNLQGWDAANNCYVTVTPSASGGESFQLEPWWGYWFLVFDKDELQIRFPKPL